MTMHIVAGGQFGSEGKGAFTAALVKTMRAPVLIRVAGPNAGHTAIDSQGRKFAFRQIPVGAIIDHQSVVIIGQGSEIDMNVLLAEIQILEHYGIPIRNRLLVDHNATVIEERHHQAESSITTGTTGKGIGAARADRLLRGAIRMRDLVTPQLVEEWEGVRIEDTLPILRNRIAMGYDLVIEGTQGFGLGLHSEFYPHATSSNTRPGDFLAMTGLQPWECPRIVPWLVFRAHPIRIAGNSGPLASETTWDGIGQATEYTTVTKKPRRVGLWDQELANAAMTAAGGAPRVRAAYMFLDYDCPDFAGQDDHSEKLGKVVSDVCEETGILFDFVGTGPNTGVWRPAMGWSR